MNLILSTCLKSPSFLCVWKGEKNLCLNWHFLTWKNFIFLVNVLVVRSFSCVLFYVLSRSVWSRQLVWSCCAGNAIDIMMSAFRLCSLFDLFPLFSLYILTHMHAPSSSSVHISCVSFSLCISHERAIATTRRV